MKEIYEKVPIVKNIYKKDEFSDRNSHFMDNLEFRKRDVA